MKDASEQLIEVEKPVETEKHLTTEEKLVLREIEVAHLKAKAELDAALRKIEETQKQFAQTLETYAGKYLPVPNGWLFDLDKFFFKKV